MKILILAIHYPVASGRYCFDAFQRLGHDVRSFGPTTGNHLWGMDVDQKYVWTPTLPDDDWVPDLTVVMDSALIVLRQEDRQLVGVIGAINEFVEIPAAPLTVVYGVDNHVRDYQLIQADHYFLGHGHGARIGEQNVTWLPCAYDPVHFTPGKPWAEREFDAAMVAVLYGQRAEMIYALRAGLPDLRMAYGTGAVYAEYAEAYQNSRISLVVSAAHDVAQRVWETAAMGCLVLMDDCPDCAALGLIDGTNCLIYKDTAEAIQKVQWAQAHPDEAAEIAAAGQAWAQDGTWDARCKTIIAWAKENAPTAQKAASNEGR